jgi:hypothetical protein
LHYDMRRAFFSTTLLLIVQYRFIEELILQD